MLDEKLTKNAQDELMLVNIIEELVKQEVDELIKGVDMCRCDKCKLNVCAIALNSLPQHYVTTKKGALLAKVQDMGISYSTEVTVEVMKALMIVKKQPLH